MTLPSEPVPVTRLISILIPLATPRTLGTASDLLPSVFAGVDIVSLLEGSTDDASAISSVPTTPAGSSSEVSATSDGAVAVASLPSSSSSTSGEFTLIISPTSPNIFNTFPERGEGMSVVTLSVSILTSKSPDLMVCPTSTYISSRVPSSSPSPISGKLKI